MKELENALQAHYARVAYLMLKSLIDLLEEDGEEYLTIGELRKMIKNEPKDVITTREVAKLFEKASDQGAKNILRSLIRTCELLDMKSVSIEYLKGAIEIIDEV